ncbi:unnamed protein product [Citrullus colocynthis]|uniref:Yippee domain-containing protein n=1 Tax=Citrullus colocynthis TaxID=252529 RepID=A0ABP0XRC0_9ROSI
MKLYTNSGLHIQGKKMKQKKKKKKISMAEYWNPTYSCRNCRNPLASGAHLLSKSFWAKSGKAFLFSEAKNIVEGAKEQKQLITGIFKTVEIQCNVCGQVLGVWFGAWLFFPSFNKVIKSSPSNQNTLVELQNGTAMEPHCPYSSFL